jgi:hypothetical protein
MHPGVPSSGHIQPARSVVGVRALAGKAALRGLGLVDVDDRVVIALEETTDGYGWAWGTTAQVVARAVAKGDDNILRRPKLGLELLDETRFAALLLSVGVEALPAMERVVPEVPRGVDVAIKRGNMGAEGQGVKCAARWLLRQPGLSLVDRPALYKARRASERGRMRLGVGLSRLSPALASCVA